MQTIGRIKNGARILQRTIVTNLSGFIFFSIWVLRVLSERTIVDRMTLISDIFGHHVSDRRHYWLLRTAKASWSTNLKSISVRVDKNINNQVAHIFIEK